MRDWWQVAKSVFAAAIGIQSNANRQRDFAQQSILPYLVVGVLFVILFIFGIIAAVNLLV